MQSQEGPNAAPEHQQSLGSVCQDDMHSSTESHNPLPSFCDDETSTSKQSTFHSMSTTAFPSSSLDILLALVRQQKPTIPLDPFPHPLHLQVPISHHDIPPSSSTHPSVWHTDAIITACEVCFSRLQPPLRTCRSCSVNTCIDCFASWLETRIQMGHAAPLSCLKCREPVSLDEVRAVCGDKLYKKHLYFLSKEQHKDDPNAAWCPRDGCWRALMDLQAYLPPSACELSCPDCQADICAKCFSFSHQGQKCPAPRFNLRHRALAHFWRRFHTKKCPSCFVHIQRAGGCTQMRCTSCKTKFCWRCRGILHFPGPSEAEPGAADTASNGNTPHGRRTHMCVCPRITEACVIVSIAGGALIVIPIALAAAIVVGPPALVVFMVLPKEKKAQAKADITQFMDRL